MPKLQCKYVYKSGRNVLMCNKNQRSGRTIHHSGCRYLAAEHFAIHIQREKIASFVIHLSFCLDVRVQNQKSIKTIPIENMDVGV